MNPALNQQVQQMVDQVIQAAINNRRAALTSSVTEKRALTLNRSTAPDKKMKLPQIVNHPK